MNRPSQLSPEELQSLRDAFPALKQQVSGKPLVYLDNAASAHKPAAVLAALQQFYSQDYSNIHRGVHALSQRATEAYENARARVARYVGAASAREIVFVKGATEGLNLIASGLGKTVLKRGDCILLTRMEHHANIVPWQLLEKELGVRIAVVPVLDDGTLDQQAYRRLLEEERPKVVSFVHASNALGTINPAREMIAAAKEKGAICVLDGAQSTVHFPLNVQELDCDFMVFAPHKLYGPTGIGVLYGKLERLMELPPYQGGGDMIEKVSFAGTTFREPPERFEAGTPPIAGVIGLAAAMDFIDSYDRQALLRHENDLRLAAEALLKEVPGLRIYGESEEKVSLVSFTVEGVHPHDFGTFLDADGIAVRVGHHCAQPLWEHFGISGTIRASFAIYNTMEEVEIFARSVRKVQAFFG